MSWRTTEASPPRAPDRTVVLIATNYSGGKRHRSGHGEQHHMARLVDVVREIAPLDAVLCVQEMATQQYGLPIAVPDIEAALGPTARSVFVPRVSTAWYPLTAKWGETVDDGASQNEGPCVISTGSATHLMPWSTLGGPKGVPSPVRVLDLPALEFRRDGENVEAGSHWITTRFDQGSMPTQSVTFRPTYYGGTRDSDPRAAQACIIGSTRPGSQEEQVPEAVVVNVHLSTLRSEYVTYETRRVPDAEASFQRDVQLALIARFVLDVKESYGIPVVVAGDFNAEPDSVEIENFRRTTGLEPVFTKAACWRCGYSQVPRPPLPFYQSSLGPGGLSLSPEVSDDVVLTTSAVCSNDACREPRFTHKGNLMMLDNVLVDPVFADGRLSRPRVDVARSYSDHAVLSCRLSFEPD